MSLIGSSNNSLALLGLNDRYDYISDIGSGGMGSIIKARNSIVDKVVAIKTLHAHLTSDKYVRRFQQEAKAINTLDNPNVVRLLDFGVTSQGQSYMIMDFIEGESLAQLIERKIDLPLAQALEIFIRVCGGMQHAHEKGVLHRDIKPSNIMVSNLGSPNLQVKVVDFGIAKLLAEDEPANSVTQTGEVFGSPLYMSPEQASGKKIEARSDIYSLGCTMYEVLTGRPPLMGESSITTIIQQLTEPAPSLAKSAPHKMFPIRLEESIATCLAKNPADRYQCMAELASDLKSIYRGVSTMSHHLEYATPATEVLAQVGGGKSGAGSVGAGSVGAGSVGAGSDRAGGRLSAGKRANVTPGAVGETPTRKSNKVLTLVMILLISLLAVFAAALRPNPPNRQQKLQSEPTQPQPSPQQSPQSQPQPSSPIVQPNNSATVKIDLAVAEFIATNADQNSVHLNHDQLTNKTLLAALSQLRHLTTLDMTNETGVDAAIPYFSALPVSKIEFGRSDISDAGLKGLLPMPNLTELNLARTPLTEASADTLGSLSHLTSLRLTSSEYVNDAFIAKLAQSPVTRKHLRQLRIGLTHVGDSAVQSLLPLQLDYLSLFGTGITDNSLPLLLRMKTLQVVNIGSCPKLTEERVKSFVSASRIRVQNGN